MLKTPIEMAIPLAVLLLAQSVKADTFGSVSAGTQHQSNAVYGSSSEIVRLLGEITPRNPALAPTSDNNLFVNSFMLHRRDLGEGTGRQFDMMLSSAMNRYDDSTNLDFTSVYGRFGISFAKPDNMRNAIKPYLIVSLSDAGSGSKSSRMGLGLDYSHSFSPSFTLFSSTTYEDVEIDNKVSTDLNIDQVRSGLSGQFFLDSNNIINVSASLTHFSSSNAFNDYLSKSLGVSYNHRFPMHLFSVDEKIWTLSLQATYTDNGYDNPLIFIDPDLLRKDDRMYYSIRNSIPFADNWYFEQSITYNESDSNLANFSYDNTGISLSIRKSFSRFSQ